MFHLTNWFLFYLFSSVFCSFWIWIPSWCHSHSFKACRGLYISHKHRGRVGQMVCCRGSLAFSCPFTFFICVCQILGTDVFNGIVQ